MTKNPIDHVGFRAQFPAASEMVWLDSPGSPPAARPITEALRETLDAWSSGTFDWLAWDRAPASCRPLIASYLNIEPDRLALLGSVAEAAATVAASLPPGRVVVPEQEFRSNLYPWQALDPDHYEVVTVPSRDGAVRTEDLTAALDDRTVLLAVSEVLTSNGIRADLRALRDATDAFGTRLFIDASQSQGVLRQDFALLRPDFVAVHGYKWMLCPRGAAWLVVRPDRVGELTPLLPSWHSDAEHGYFGGSLTLQDSAARCDTPAAWLPWIGACAALTLQLRTDPGEVEHHCLRLAGIFATEARALGHVPLASGLTSHIVVLRHSNAGRVRAAFAASRVRASVLSDRVRLGFHYFNDDSDVEAALGALRTAAAA
ncbi:aminotransferase class V-fold PLP-dependent enzyme [Streptomyces sp. R39]|uniref:Aminotransferase class V-fold PLP-dependent enzyme n=1 Tax=Streptomyces sp. R39 TaxID=3238631 RepID=A0AB39QVE4_9ACTN